MAPISTTIGVGHLDRKDEKGMHSLELPGPSPALSKPQRKGWKLVSRVLHGLVAAAVCTALLRQRFPGGPSGLDGRVIEAPTGQKAEQLYLSVPDADTALAASRLFATHPHLAGSKEDLADAKAILELFQNEFDIDEPTELPIFPAGTASSRSATLNITSRSAPAAWIDVYYPVMNTPLDRSLQLLDSDGNSVWDADLVEDGDPRDPEAAEYRDFVPTFHGLSADGDVEGQLVYVNYGHKSDYDALVEKGVNFTGKITLARYGGNFRGLKIQAAQNLGAVGVLIYSDPRDDGYVTVENGFDTYPGGPARNPTAVQRGSVQFLSTYPGDPTTPGYPAYEDAERTEGSNIPKIPSLPISWANAQVLLAELGGNKEGRKLNGNITERKVRLVNHVDTKVTPIWNTMASIPGHVRDEVVLIGCHRDAWVMGAADPTSGTVSLHEIVRGFGKLMAEGWKPLRTIVFASWDAEEYGLIGSTEWGEDFPEWISSKLVAYLNVDVSVAGSRWAPSASPSLSNLIVNTAKDIPHPTKEGKTLLDAQNDDGPFSGDNFVIDADFEAAYASARRPELTNLGVYALGSGSDFTVFLQRLGVAAMDEGFGVTPTDAPWHYHSIYDSQHWQETYADPDFSKHVAVAQHLGLTALRLTDAIILPINTTQYALELGVYLDRVRELAADSSVDTDFDAVSEAIINLHKASIWLDDEKAEAEKKFKKLLAELPKHINSCANRRFEGFRTWVKALFGVQTPCRPLVEQSTDVLLAYLGEFSVEGDDVETSIATCGRVRDDSPIRKFIKAAKRVRKANQKLRAFEQGFISEEGIQDREWYRHLAVAPGKYEGYGATTLPALTEALVIEKNATLVAHEADRLVVAFKEMASALRA